MQTMRALVPVALTLVAVLGPRGAFAQAGGGGVVETLAIAEAKADQAPAPPLDGPRRPLQDSLLDRLVGTWSMTGAVRSAPANYTLKAEWVLNHQFLKLDMRDVAEPPAYQATWYLGYDNASERYVTHLLDTFGGRIDETLGFGERHDQAIRFVFEYPDGPFHTTFSLELDGRAWSVLMQNRGATGTWQEFAHYTVVRR